MRPTQKLHQPPLLYDNACEPQMLTVRAVKIAKGGNNASRN